MDAQIHEQLRLNNACESSITSLVGQSYFTSFSHLC